MSSICATTAIRFTLGRNLNESKTINMRYAANALILLDVRRTIGGEINNEDRR
jgi:hypothetical protein